MRPILLTLTAALLTLLATLAAIDIRTDMADFLPQGTTPAARIVFDQARRGTATGLILLAIEGAPTPDLARIARTLQSTLPATGLFQLVAGGQADPRDQALLFDHRYALSPATTAEAFTTPALHQAMQSLLAQLRSSAAPLVMQFGLPDPPGAFFALLRQWAGDTRVRSIDGAWFDPSGARALLLARTRAGGMDIPAQEAALAAIDAAFHAAAPGPARLVAAGPAVFARDAARAIRGDVERISIVSTLAVLALLWWRFRSLLVLAAIAAPVVLSVAIAALTVQALFGMVHGVAIGFGATMLGVSVDYPVLMIGHRKRGEPAPATRRRIGRAFVLAVLSAALGLAAMLLSGFPGLIQLGTFAATGLLACAALTWFLLPPLIVRANLAPVAAGDQTDNAAGDQADNAAGDRTNTAAADPDWLARIEAWRRHRAWAALPPAAAALFLATHGIAWETDLQALSPVPPASLALDRELRAQLGAPEPGQMLLVRGPTIESVLQQQEALRPLLERLTETHAIAAADYAARLLPSAATQAARTALLPDAATLAASIEAARAGLPFRAEAFRPFAEAVEATRTAPPLRLDDLAGTLAGARLAAMLLPQDGAWIGPVLLSGVTGPIDAGPTPYLDIRRDLGTQLGAYTTATWTALAGSLAVIVALLLAGLRDLSRTLRVLAAVAAALLVTVAVLAASGARLSLIHLVALQLVAGVGLDYALFYARRQLDAEERARTLRTLVTCNAMTLLTFGLLAACQTPLLRDIGVTVAIGALLAMGFAFMVVGRAEHEAE